MPFKIQIRRDTSAAWTAANPVLAAGELGHATDTGALRVGDGVRSWSALGAIGAGGAGTNDIILMGDSITARSWDIFVPITNGLTHDGSGLATLTVSTDHHAFGGAKVTLTSIGFPTYAPADAAWDGQYTITAVPSARSVQFQVAATCSVAPTGVTNAYVQMSNGTSQSSAYWHWLQNSPMGKHRFRVVANVAKSGRGSDQLANQSRILDVYPRARVLCMIGVNDIYTSVPPETTVARIAAMIVAAGSRPVDICTIAPLRPSLWTRARSRQIIRCNELIRALPLTYPNVKIHDVYSWTIDPVSVQGYALSGMIIEADGVHPTSLGAKVWGGNMAANYLAWLGPPVDGWATSVGEGYEQDASSSNKFQNPLMLAGTGGTKTSSGGGGVPTGTVAQYWTLDNQMGGTTQAIVASIAARTVEADGDAYGNNQVLTITTTSGAVGQFYQNAAIPRGALAGETWTLRAHVQGSNLAGKLDYLNLWAGGTSGKFALTGISAIDDAFVGDTLDLWLEATVIIPSGETADWPTLNWHITGATTDLVLKIGRMKWEKQE
jgi:lysophospholipase L1-like esterase